MHNYKFASIAFVLLYIELEFCPKICRCKFPKNFCLWGGGAEILIFDNSKAISEETDEEDLYESYYDDDLLRHGEEGELIFEE